mgnify:CR=1 FL=1
MHVLDKNKDEDRGRGTGGGRGSTTVIQWTDRGQRRGGGDGYVREERCTMGPSASFDDGCVWGWCLRATFGTGPDQWSARHARGAEILNNA